MVNKEIRFVVVWDSETNKYYVDEEMAYVIFDEADVWLPDESEWEGLADHEEDYQVAREGLINLFEMNGSV